jgi:hypothetical protein
LIWLQQKTATRVGRFFAVNRCGRWLRSTEYRVSLLGWLCHPLVRDARGTLREFDILSRKSRQPRSAAHQQHGSRLTDFDSPGQFWTMGDKMTLFLAVFLKKVDVL